MSGLVFASRTFYAYGELDLLLTSTGHLQYVPVLLASELEYLSGRRVLSKSVANKVVVFFSEMTLKMTLGPHSHR
jgi:hypothetical protein